MAEQEPELRYFEESLYPMRSHHMKQIEAHFPLRSPGGLVELNKSIAGARTVFICFTNRVGSNLLTDLLNQAGFGVNIAEENFNAAKVLASSAINNLKDFASYLAYACKVTRRHDSIFLKIGAAQLMWLSNRGYVSDFFSDAKFLFIRRRDKLAQAVSLYIMNSTGQYLAGMGPDNKSVAFDPKEIARQLKWIVDNESLFLYFFALHSVSPLEIWYEDLVSSPSQTLSAVARHCGLPDLDYETMALSAENATVKRQYATINDKFIKEMQRLFALAAP